MAPAVVPPGEGLQAAPEQACLHGKWDVLAGQAAEDGCTSMYYCTSLAREGQACLQVMAEYRTQLCRPVLA